MGYIKNKVSVAAGASLANVLSGSAFEFVSEESQVEIGILASAAGLLASVTSGTDILLETDSAVDVVRTANQGPVYPDDYGLTDVALPGDRLRITVRNPTAGAIDFFYAVRITPQ